MSFAPIAVADFSGPLFGLATTPKGDVLIADTGAGIIDRKSGQNTFPALPGITDIAPIGNSALWVSRSGGEGLFDHGQALLRVSKGQVKVVANLFEFEATYNPQTDDVRSNPYDVHSLGGEAALVADAAANDLLHIDFEGNIDVVAVFPTRLVDLTAIKAALGCAANPVPPVCTIPANAIPAQAVPTSIAVGPDGYYYVGELRGFPGPINQSSIWRIAPGASWADCGNTADCEKIFDGGFTSIIDLVLGPEGLLYVVELDENGWFAAQNGFGVGGTINACDLDTLDCVEVATGIPFITAITFGKDGQLWATRNAVVPPIADVIAIP
ncbi:MAG TPA: ScyD/ScyE family protein [Xanthomonadales bacterium]|nr:ScyD/ScyE family protein [Xanthomonadales bacterium]